MERLRCIITGALLLVLNNGIALAQDGPEGNDRPPRHMEGGPQEGGPGPGDEMRHGPGGGMRAFFQDLGISDEQKSKMMEIRKNSNVKDLRKQFMDEKDKLKDLIHDKSSTESNVMPQLDKVNQVQANLNKARVKNIIALRGILTPEQFAKLRQKIQERKESWHERFSGQNGPGGEEFGRRPFGQNRGPMGGQGQDMGQGPNGPGNHIHHEDDGLDLGF